MLGLTVVIPLGAWLARRCGERRVLVGLLLLFGLAGAAVAPSIGVLLGWRLVQAGRRPADTRRQAMAYRAYAPEARAADIGGDDGRAARASPIARARWRAGRSRIVALDLRRHASSPGPHAASRWPGCSPAPRRPSCHRSMYRAWP